MSNQERENLREGNTDRSLLQELDFSFDTLQLEGHSIEIAHQPEEFANGVTRLTDRPYLKPAHSDFPLTGEWDEDLHPLLEQLYQSVRSTFEQSQQERLRQLLPLLDETPMLPWISGLVLKVEGSDQSRQVIHLPPEASDSDFQLLRNSLREQGLPDVQVREGVFYCSPPSSSWKNGLMFATGQTPQTLHVLYNQQLFRNQRDPEAASIVIQIGWVHELEHVRILNQTPPLRSEKEPIEVQELFLRELAGRTVDERMRGVIEQNRVLAEQALRRF